MSPHPNFTLAASSPKGLGGGEHWGVGSIGGWGAWGVGSIGGWGALGGGEHGG